MLDNLINNPNFWCKFNDNSVIITIFANKNFENRLHLSINELFEFRNFATKNY